MGRAPRIDAPGLVHHVVAVGNRRERVVHDDIDRHRLVTTVARVARKCDWECQAYCLLDTHLHLIVATRAATLGTGIKSILGGHARRLNQRHGREGHVWTQRYFSRPTEWESYLLQACAYVVLNPVHAGLCLHPRHWRWSSYRATAGLEPTTDALGASLLLGMLDRDESRARERWVAWVEAALAAPAPVPAAWEAVSD